MKFILFHGSFGSPTGNWLPWLKTELLNLGREVVVPKFPVDDFEEMTKFGREYLMRNQSLENWLKVFEGVAKSIKSGEKLCFIGHSLGCVFILHAVSKWSIQLDSAIFAAPFMEKLNQSWQIDLANHTFWKSDFDFEKLRKLIPVSTVLYGDNDPHVEEHFALDFAEKLDSRVEIIKNGGHLNAKAGFLEFPQVLEICKNKLN